MARIIVPKLVAGEFRDEIREQIKELGKPLHVKGFLATDARPSEVYAQYTRLGCEDVGIRFSQVKVQPNELKAAIQEANEDKSVHGIMVYYPIIDAETDREIKETVSHTKDIEGLTHFWISKLYNNIRHVDEEKTKKAILPCTPLAILKLLERAGCHRPESETLFGGAKTVIFNRSEVVGRPLASMMANDGAQVISFDEFGPKHVNGQHFEDTDISREEALRDADIVITGVPSKRFPLVRAEEVQEGCVCVNFSTLRNYQNDVREKASVFIPRVGPMTVTMVLRNTLRLYLNYHSKNDSF